MILKNKLFKKKIEQPLLDGYHYTTESNWAKIQKRGLTPKPITKYEVTRFYDHSIKGIWIWKNRPTSLGHLGNLFMRYASQGETKLVLLKVQYRKTDQLAAPDPYGYINITNPIYLSVGGDEIEIDPKTSATILSKSIPLERITLLGEYNLVKRLM